MLWHFPLFYFEIPFVFIFKVCFSWFDLYWVYSFILLNLIASTFLLVLIITGFAQGLFFALWSGNKYVVLEIKLGWPICKVVPSYCTLSDSSFFLLLWHLAHMRIWLLIDMSDFKSNVWSVESKKYIKYSFLFSSC